MGSRILNTAYSREYVVVSKEPNYIVLRVMDDETELYNTYWKEFISAEAILSPGRNPMYLKIEQAPQAVTLVDQFSEFTPEIPIVYLEVGDRRVNVSSKVAVNIPNIEVPGLFRLDYRINLNDGNVSTVFWSSYVSIQQRPLLRKAAGGWVRDSYIIRTLNRLVMEPQFMEALHAAGEPLYGFMQANQHPSIPASLLSKYAGVQAWGVGAGTVAGNGPTIFITGAKLPQGSIVIYRRRMLQLREPVYPDTLGSVTHMDAETHKRAPGSYSAGAVRRIGRTSYICIADASAEISLNDMRHWKAGYLYRFSVLDGESFHLPYGPLPIKKGGIEHIWATVDSQGYPFWVDISHTTNLGTYRGHYDMANFADYNSDDIVSYVTDDSIRLFARKHTDIQDESTLSYPPGHYLNPAWEEIYCRMPGDYSPLLSDYSIVPHTNASNAIVAKTWSVSEEMCRAYSHMVGIPQSIMDACGAKWSALLFALLTRTRNTFEGFRICMRAVGLDVKNLVLSDPSISYSCNPDGTDAVEVKDVYTQHDNLRKLVANISTLQPFGETTPPEEGALAYDKDDPNVILQYSEGEWIQRYRFSEIEPTQIHNNRYYDCDLTVLARLAEDAVKELGDGKTWVKASAWAGEYSALVADVIAYEIPIYVWVRLHMHLYDESKIEMETAVYSGILDGQRCGGKNILELFPTRYFNRMLGDYVTIETGVYVNDDGSWSELVPTRINESRGSKIYEFDRVAYPIRIRAVNLEENTFIRYWQSTHTFGLLGLPESTSTDHFRNVTDPEATDESDLMLANGYVGVTALYRPKSLGVDTAKALRWMYVLNNPEATDVWRLSNTTPFADWENLSYVEGLSFEGSIDTFKSTLAKIETAVHDGEDIPFAWDDDVLVFHNLFAPALYCKDANGKVIFVITLIPGAHTMTSADWAEYQTPTESIRISFQYG